ncbi:MAG: hypothetical protein ACK56F_02140, partial [bacterium]
AVDVSRTGQRGVNSTDTVTRTITSASDSAAWERCSLSHALSNAERSWEKSSSKAKRRGLSRNVTGEQPEIPSTLPTVEIPRRSIAGMKTDQSQSGTFVYEFIFFIFQISIHFYICV